MYREDPECITLNLKEKCIYLFVLKGYGGKDDKLHYLTSHLANLTLYLGIYKEVSGINFPVQHPSLLRDNLPSVSEVFLFEYNLELISGGWDGKDLSSFDFTQ